MDGLSFPKPVRVIKQKKGLRFKSRQETATVPGRGSLGKPATVKDPGLLRSIRGRPCVECGSHLTDPHHYIPRSHQQLDIKENLDPFCWQHHAEIERGNVELEVKHFLQKDREGLAMLRELAPTAGIWQRVQLDGGTYAEHST